MDMLILLGIPMFCILPLLYLFAQWLERRDAKAALRQWNAERDRAMVQRALTTFRILNKEQP